MKNDQNRPLPKLAPLLAIGGNATNTVAPQCIVGVRLIRRCTLDELAKVRG